MRLQLLILKYICSRYGVTVVGWSSDGDPRLLAAMCYEISLNSLLQFIQDIIHIATKLRNRLLNELCEMMMGSSKVSLTYLKELVKNVHKSVHGLTMSDVPRTDKIFGLSKKLSKAEYSKHYKHP